MNTNYKYQSTYKTTVRFKGQNPSESLNEPTWRPNVMAVTQRYRNLKQHMFALLNFNNSN